MSVWDKKISIDRKGRDAKIRKEVNNYAGTKLNLKGYPFVFRFCSQVRAGVIKERLPSRSQ